MVQSGNYHILIQKLDAFTRRFYLNKLIRGSLITLGSILAVFLVYALLENQFYFDGTMRRPVAGLSLGGSLGAQATAPGFPQEG